MEFKVYHREVRSHKEKPNNLTEQQHRGLGLLLFNQICLTKVFLALFCPEKDS